MLKQRIITAIILLPIAVGLILYAPLAWLAAALLLVVALGAHEWAALAGYSGEAGRIAYVAATLAWCGALYMLGRYADWLSVMWPTMIAAAIWWISILVWIAFRRRSVPRSIKAVCGWLTLVPALFAAVAIAAYRPALLLWLFAIIWAADIGAYFAGKAFGRHKLAPEVSPGKTWEGIAGGTLAMLIVALCGWWWLTSRTQPVLIAICLLTGWLSVVGDLSESLLKRQAGAKDSGTLFPGHGGVLDRVDSLTAAAPFFWIGLKLAGWLV
ncbi:MAG TPA: phosphatidate cytidylyltransferase [Gammaproteobacteria bacterium]|nr:phosphatidate cytidylyltransferase [Gammaproteobacteria bacterium]